ncbi:MAG: sulfatase-like hydrolase/transferase, partial [Acidobacteria bacterium]|nr:sulfatase-like hydrolase/transferase [Acidobacteriota bacterium]
MRLLLIIFDGLGDRPAVELDRQTPLEAARTPNLDRLAKTGARFQHCYSQPLCTPSRVQIMTGKYNYRNYTNFGKLRTDQVTFANILEKAGYAAREADKAMPEGGDEQAEARQWKHKLIVSSVFTAPLLVLAMSHGTITFPGAFPGMEWVQLLLTLPVIFYGGSQFYRSAWAAARH